MQYDILTAVTLIYTNCMNHLLPSVEDMVTLLQAALVCVICGCVGYLCIRKRVIAEISVFVGMAVVVVLGMLWGYADISLPWFRYLIFLLGLAGAGVALYDIRQTNHPITQSTLYRIMVVSSPLLLFMASRILWQSDALNTWVPNYQHIYLNDSLLIEGHGSAHLSSLIFFPLIGYVGSVFQFTPRILMHINTILFFLSLAFIVRIWVLTFHRSNYVLSWKSSILAVPLFLAVNYYYPIIFSSYVDLLISILFAIVIYLHLVIRARSLSPKSDTVIYLTIFLVASAMVLLKASGIILVALWYIAYGLTSLRWSKHYGRHIGVLACILLAVMLCWYISFDWMQNHLVRSQVPTLSTLYHLFEILSVQHAHTWLHIAVLMLKSLLASPVLLGLFILVVAMSVYRLFQPDGRDHTILHAVAIVVVGYILARISIYTVFMNNPAIVSNTLVSSQRYAYHVYYVALMVVILEAVHIRPLTMCRSYIATKLDRVSVKLVVLGYALLFIALLPFIRNDIRERKYFMHDIGKSLSTAVQEDVQSTEYSNARITMTHDVHNHRAMHYTHLLGGIMSINMPGANIHVQPGDAKKVLSASPNHYHLHFCQFTDGKYYANLFRYRKGDYQTLQAIHIPFFNDSRTQICQRRKK